MIEMRRESVTILCSGASLGAYIPALVASRQLAKFGIDCEVIVLENIMLKNKRDNVSKTKFAFHRNFSLALMAQKMARDISPSIDAELKSALLKTWKDQECRRFMVFSGFWLPIVNQYLTETDRQDITIDLCHMDASVSTSWKMYDTTDEAFRHIWLFNWEEKCLNYQLCVSDTDPVPYSQRNERFLIHGGGWGVGTYKNKILELADRRINLDIIVYEQQDLENRIEQNRYFMIDPTWKPWSKDQNGKHQFPPFGEVDENKTVKFQNSQPYPEVYRLIQQSRGIISKPGGGTLIDSLSAATPLVLLSPYGDYENSNKLLWEYLGFGICYEKWAESGYSGEILEKLHQNLLEARTDLPAYIASYVSDWAVLPEIEAARK